MYKPPKIQVQFLIEPPDAIEIPKAEYERPLLKFVNTSDILNSIFKYSVLFIMSMFMVVLIVVCAVLGKKIE